MGIAMVFDQGDQATRWKGLGDQIWLEFLPERVGRGCRKAIQAIHYSTFQEHLMQNYYRRMYMADT